MGRILILGTEEAERDGLALVMEFAGHSCATAGSLQEAVDLIGKGSYDLVLVDSTMGDNGSDQIVRAIKNVSPAMAVIVITEEAEFGPDAEVITLPYSPVQNLSPQFSTIGKKEALLVLLPEEESLKRLSDLPQTAGMLNKLAVLYHFQEKYAAAERLYKRALKISEKTSGSQHREVASILNNLANLYHDQKRYAEAEPLYKRSLTIVEKIFGANHPKAARRISNLADLYHTQGKLEQAALLEERLRNREKALRK
ncbi:MAG: tetratricopeptide repeat protein [Acidobacteria bacterium]|nr:tetratricopeptide repeat protein [Acidobacteriota bacterium]